MLDCWNHFFNEIYILLDLIVKKKGWKRAELNLNEDLYNHEKVAQRSYGFQFIENKNKISSKNNYKSSANDKRRMLEWNLEMLSIEMNDKSVRK